MAADFRRLVSDHEGLEVKHRLEQRRAAVEERRHRVAELIDHHITDESWRGLMHQARLAAERGEKEFMLLRFPSQLCSDGGRAVNAGEPHWPATLRGEAAEIYLYWERDLKPHGFRLAASVLDFPDGMQGDVGLFLTGENEQSCPNQSGGRLGYPGQRSRSGLVPCCRSRPIDLDQCRTTGSTSSISGGKAAIGMARVGLFQ
jgi:hypothetical protein